MGIIQDKPVSITEEELQELKSLQQAKQDLIFALGELEYEKLRLEAQKQTLEVQFNRVVQSEYEVSQRISEKDIDYAGGGTWFWRQKYLSRPPQGYISVHPGNITHKHGARPVLSGKRYIIVSFMKNKEF